MFPAAAQLRPRRASLPLNISSRPLCLGVGEWQVSSHSSWTCAACVEFCKINFIPAAILVYASASVGAWDTPVWAALTAGYIYFGYVAFREERCWNAVDMYVVI